MQLDPGIDAVPAVETHRQRVRLKHPEHLGKRRLHPCIVDVTRDTAAAAVFEAHQVRRVGQHKINAARRMTLTGGRRSRRQSARPQVADAATD